MSYYFADANGYVADAASIGGWRDFSGWVDTLTEAQTLRSFVQQGVTHEPKKLVQELLPLKAAVPSVNGTRLGLIVAAANAEELLIVTDGTSDVEEPDAGELVKTLAAQLPPWKRIHAAADRFEPLLHEHFQKAFDRGRKTVSERTIENLLPLGHQAVEVALDRAVLAVEKSATQGLEPLLVEVYTAGESVAHKNLAALLRASASGTVNNKRAIAWAQQHAGQLVQGVTKTTRENIREAISAPLEGEITLKDAAKFIAEQIGDESRARTIARTESMTAVSEGQRGAWTDAKADGTLSGTDVRVWIATPDESCDLCAELDGQEAELEGEYPGDGGDGPPLHVNCRCTEGIQRSEA